MLTGAITLAVEVIDPSFKMPANLREFFTPENIFISTQLFGGLSIFCGGSEKIKEAVTNACRKKAEILKPYLKLPQ